MRKLTAALLAFALTAPLACSDAASPNLQTVIQRAVNDPARPAAYRKADPLRKPAETLVFSGVRPGMTVGESIPPAAISRAC